MIYVPQMKVLVFKFLLFHTAFDMPNLFLTHVFLKQFRIARNISKVFIVI